jgi:hypothetical protein
MTYLPIELINRILILRPTHPTAKIISDFKSNISKRFIINSNNVIYNSFMEFSLNIIRIDENPLILFKNYLFNFESRNDNVLYDYDNIYTQYGGVLESLFFEFGSAIEYDYYENDD